MFQGVLLHLSVRQLFHTSKSLLRLPHGLKLPFCLIVLSIIDQVSVITSSQSITYPHISSLIIEQFYVHVLITFHLSQGWKPQSVMIIKLYFKVQPRLNNCLLFLINFIGWGRGKVRRLEHYYSFKWKGEYTVLSMKMGRWVYPFLSPSQRA